ncbi:hypothetical protein F2Q70_00010373 [Brassica cretica]|uniref:Uncharacterized protein n=1 Tax=Brassica cretica TaxID=69181 RepID=A0A8S9LZZ5_BRACR|nr:hypothetical protein F2Q70_00010373 [Brassica cretica]
MGKRKKRILSSLPLSSKFSRYVVASSRAGKASSRVLSHGSKNGLGSVGPISSKNVLGSVGLASTQDGSTSAKDFSQGPSKVVTTGPTGSVGDAPPPVGLAGTASVAVPVSSSSTGDVLAEVDLTKRLLPADIPPLSEAVGAVSGTKTETTSDNTQTTLPAKNGTRKYSEVLHKSSLVKEIGTPTQHVVGVENGYDEVNVQIPAKYKYVFSQQIMLGQEKVATYVPEIKLRSNSI